MGLTCIRWDLSLGHAGSVVAAHRPSCPMAHRILVPQPESNPHALPWEATTGVPQKSLLQVFTQMTSQYEVLQPSILTAAVLCYAHVRLFATPWTVISQAPLSMGFPRQEYWSDLPFSSPGDFPNPGIEPVSPALTGRFLYLLSCLESPSLLTVNRYFHLC